MSEKKSDEMAKDTLAIIETGKEEVIKIHRVKSYRSPEKGAGWIAYQLEKPLPDTAKKTKTAVFDSVKINFKAPTLLLPTLSYLFFPAHPMEHWPD